jgi:hypothetical protein
MSPSNGLNARIFLIVSNSIGRQVVGRSRWSRFDSEPSPPGFFAGFSAAAVDSYGRRFRSRGICFCFPSVTSDFRRRRLLSTTAAVSYRRECWSRSRFLFYFFFAVRQVRFFFSFQTFFCEIVFIASIVLFNICYYIFDLFYRKLFIRFSLLMLIWCVTLLLNAYTQLWNEENIIRLKYCLFFYQR